MKVIVVQHGQLSKKELFFFYMPFCSLRVFWGSLSGLDHSKTLFEFQLNSAKRFYVIFEEAQTSFPLYAMRSKNFQNSLRVVSVGRNVGVSACAISQFPSLVDKELVKNAQQIYVGVTSEITH